MHLHFNKKSVADYGRTWTAIIKCICERSRWASYKLPIIKQNGKLIRKISSAFCVLGPVLRVLWKFSRAQNFISVAFWYVMYWLLTPVCIRLNSSVTETYRNFWSWFKTNHIMWQNIENVSYELLRSCLLYSIRFNIHTVNKTNCEHRKNGRSVNSIHRYFIILLPSLLPNLRAEKHASFLFEH